MIVQFVNSVAEAGANESPTLTSAPGGARRVAAAGAADEW
jgi:hypothetical protein